MYKNTSLMCGWEYEYKETTLILIQTNFEMDTNIYVYVNVLRLPCLGN